MKRLNPRLARIAQTIAVLALALGAYLAVQHLVGEPSAHALPEFATRTGEPCAACHVNPGGGGPRTLRGLLWAARGRPDDIPQLPGLLLAPGVTEGLELYDIGCAGCHGFSGEGLFGIDLAGSGISKAAARSFIRRGIPELAMPAFEGQFTEEQLEALSEFVAELGEGKVPPREIALPPPKLACEPVSVADCRGE